MKKFLIILSIVMFLAGCVVPAICFVRHIKFVQNCEGYLKQSADASTIEIAIERLDEALLYIEDNHLTSGYTSIIYKTQDEDLGFWYKNLIAARQVLEDGKNCETQLEETNILMRYRETIADNGENGFEVTIPMGISRYPNNKGFCIGLIFSFLFITCAIGLFYWAIENY